MVKKKVFIALSSVSMSKKKSFLALPSGKDILVVEKLFWGCLHQGMLTEEQGSVHLTSSLRRLVL
jgi:hypothetical protein